MAMNANCNRCSRQICSAWQTAKGKYYHPQCFTCAICDSIIESISQLEDYNLKEIYCMGCHNEYFNKKNEESHLSQDNNMTLTFESPCCGNTRQQQCCFHNTPAVFKETIDQKRPDITPKVPKDLLWRPTRQEYSRQVGETPPLRNFDFTFKENSKNIVTGADTKADIGERFNKKPQNQLNKSVLKVESSTVQPPVSTSRISRLTSMSKLTPPYQLVHDLRGQSESQRCFAPSKEQSTKINDFLCSKESQFFEKCVQLPCKSHAHSTPNHWCIGNLTLCYCPTPKHTQSKTLSKKKL